MLNDVSTFFTFAMCVKNKQNYPIVKSKRQQNALQL